MICPKCGNENHEEAKFCSICGEMLQPDNENNKIKVLPKPQTSNIAYPNIKQAIWLLVLMILIALVVFFPFDFAGRLTKYPVTKHFLTYAAVTLISTVIVLKIGLKKTGKSIREVFSFKPVNPLILAITAIGIGILISEVANILRYAYPMPEQFAKDLSNLFGWKDNILGGILVLVIVAPLAEELLFRGLILHGFLNNYSTRKAIIVSAILFGLFHQNPWQLFGATIFGILFAWIFVKTKSLIPCIFSHALVNAFPMIMNLSNFEISGFSGEFTNKVQFQPLWFDITGLILALLGIVLFVQMNKKLSNPKSENVIIRQVSSVAESE